MTVPGKGGPPKAANPKGVAINVRLTAEQAARLVEIARTYDANRSEAVRHLIESWRGDR